MFIERADITLPADLIDFEDDLKSIDRFAGKLADNVLDHTLRAVAIAKHYLAENSELHRMIAIHDIPEIIIGDEILPDKITKMADEDAAEIAAARKLLSEDDYKLFVQFKNAEHWLHTLLLLSRVS